MRDLQLWLQAASGGTLPQDCYAALRADDAKVSGAPIHCSVNEASCLGPVPDGCCKSIVVDLFQKVGSVVVNVVEPGSFSEAEVSWPSRNGPEVVRLRFAAVNLDVAAETANEEDHLVKMKQVMSGSVFVEPPESPLKIGHTLTTPLPVVPSSSIRSAADRMVAVHTSPNLVVPQVSQGPPLRSPRDEETQKPYKPIVLNNCDQIIPNLYLGGIAAASDTEQLVQQGIRAVVCCVRELEFPTREFAPQVEYFRVDVEDISREPIELFFPEATEFIHSWISREQPVLVHCRAGVSRSASVVIAYLISYHGYSLHDAFFLVRSHRSIVTPNIGFMEKLGEHEEARRGTEPTIDINKYVAWYTTPERAAVPDLKPD